MNASAIATETENHKENGLLPLLLRAFAANRPLTVMGATMLVTFFAILVGFAPYHRVITGAPAWLKPAKFALSVSVYCFTFVWLLGFVENRPRLVRLVASVTVASTLVEMILIVTQAARETTSHFNMTTPFNSFVWMTMGIFILFVWAMNLLLAVMLIRQRMQDRAFAWSLRLGVLLSAAGMAAAFFMVTPRPEQIAAIAYHSPRIVGAHSVGVADGGPGLPVFGWSTVGGDLRVAHFVGLHALQVLPFLGWLLSRRKGLLAPLTSNERLTLVWTAGLVYLALILLLVRQALRGQSVIRPDTQTMATLVALAATATTSTLIVAVRVLNRKWKSRGLAAAIQILSREDV
jgi:hypothetical protein